MDRVNFDDFPVAPAPALTGNEEKRIEAHYQVWGLSGKKNEKGEPEFWRNDHDAEVVKVTDSGCLLFGHVEDDLLMLDHGYAAGKWAEFKRIG